MRWMRFLMLSALFLLFLWFWLCFSPFCFKISQNCEMIANDMGARCSFDIHRCSTLTMFFSRKWYFAVFCVASYKRDSVDFKLSLPNVWNMFAKLSLLSSKIPDNTILLDVCLGISRFFSLDPLACVLLFRFFWLFFFLSRVCDISLQHCVTHKDYSCGVLFKWKNGRNFRRFEVKRLETNDKWHTAISIYIIAAHIFLIKNCLYKEISFHRKYNRVYCIWMICWNWHGI